MPRQNAQDTRLPINNAKLLDSLANRVALVRALAQSQALQRVAACLRIARQGGYTGVDVWIFLLLLFSAGKSIGIKKVYEEVIGGHRRAAGALFGRLALMSRPALSRALAVSSLIWSDRRWTNYCSVTATWLA